MTPSEFYKQRRPEFFSDSEIVTQVALPREYLSFELNKISTNQKQDEFETLCRRLAEKFISPNLIPQVGPTGGGDGKTDSETYPVSETISNRWFTPENGWDKDENWAFAISAKEEWKGKAKGDVKKIVETARGYTRVYFMSNQLISSKKKKDAQDEFIKEFEIDVVILDGEWILEKTYNNNLIDLVVDSLNLSYVYKNKETKLGSNDTRRLEELKELEENINNSNRYSEYDFQLTEDAIRSAILSRMLEKPKDEIEGKFDRALRFCNKLKNRRQLMRIYYQKAWTYMNWYDEYALFVENFKNFKSFISKESNLSEIEDYCTLFTSLYSLKRLERKELDNLNINLEIEEKEITNLLEHIASNSERPTSSLFAKTQLLFFKLLQQKTDISQIFNELSIIIEQSKSHLDYPFDSTRTIIEEIFSEMFFDNDEFDNLIDVLALVSAERNSELEAGQIFLRRATKKLQSENYKDSIIYFGKSIKKLAKEETQNEMYFVLMGLAIAYKNLGLIWASNNCYVTACHFSFKLFAEKGTISEKTYRVVKEILTNELFIGRIPSLLTWHEMFLILQRSLKVEESEDEIEFDSLCDGTLSVRLIHTKNTHYNDLKYLPDMLAKQELWLSQDTALYKQGHIEQCIEDREDIEKEEDLDKYYKMVANQPFVEQMIYDTNCMVGEKLSLYSNLLGCKFQINFTKDIEMLLVSETLLAYFESFVGTSLLNIHAHREKIIINIFNNEENTDIYFTYDEDTYEYNFYIKSFNTQEKEHSLVWKKMIEFTVTLLFNNFIISDAEEHFKKLFEKDEIYERLALVFGHRNSVLNILGDNPKLFLDDWISYYKPEQYVMKRENPISYCYEEILDKNQQKYTKEDIGEIRHNQIKTHTVIDMALWDKAKLNGFGFTLDNKGMGIFLAFKNEFSAKQIFKEWKRRVGNIDKEELIKILIIKGINKKKPNWYRVVITINEKALQRSNTDKFFNIPLRSRIMTPDTPDNLNNLIYGIKVYKQYKLFPLLLDDNGKSEPFFDYAIIKTSLIIKDAWEIGENDLEKAAIQKDDNPIIPDKYKNNAPVLDILK